MEKELLIEVKNMTKFFGPTQALKGVNLKFYRGEIRGLIGAQRKRKNYDSPYDRRSGAAGQRGDHHRRKSGQ